MISIFLVQATTLLSRKKYEFDKISADWKTNNTQKAISGFQNERRALSSAKIKQQNMYVLPQSMTAYRPIGYERVHLPLHEVADTPFHIQGD